MMYIEKKFSIYFIIIFDVFTNKVNTKKKTINASLRNIFKNKNKIIDNNGIYELISFSFFIDHKFTISFDFVV